MRNLDTRPYSVDEKRVAEWWSHKVGIGGGDDPIGSLIVSHEYLAHERNHLRGLLRRFRDLYRQGKVSINEPIWTELAEAIE